MRRGEFKRVPELVTAIDDHVAHHNTAPKPPEFDTYDTQVIDSYRTSIKTADYKKGLVRSVGVG